MNPSYILSNLSFSLLILFLGISNLQGQDIHFSQFANSPANLSPAQAGVFGGDMRFAANYRNQWRRVPVPYNTFSGSAENKFYLKPGIYDRFLTGALLVNYDQQGDLRLTSVQVGIPISFTVPVVKNQFLTLGVTPMFGQRSFSSNSLTFGDQWLDCFYDPAHATRENMVFSSNSLTYFDVSAGINYRLQSAAKRSKLDLGGSLFHINQPKHNFWNPDNTGDDVRLASRLGIFGIGVMEIASKTDLIGSVHYQKQNTYRQTVMGLAGRYHLNTQPNKELAIQAGVAFRSGYMDALIPQIEALYRTWQLGFSYDINLSDFDLATNRRGGPELSLIYRLYRVKPLPAFKSCPII